MYGVESFTIFVQDQNFFARKDELRRKKDVVHYTESAGKTW